MEVVATTGAPQRIRFFVVDALYKSTFTYLLTYLLQSHRLNPHSQLFTSWMPFCCPVKSIRALMEKVSHLRELLSPSSPGCSSMLVFDHYRLLITLVPWKRIVKPQDSRVAPVPRYSKVTNKLLICSWLIFSLKGANFYAYMWLICHCTLADLFVP